MYPDKTLKILHIWIRSGFCPHLQIDVRQTLARPKDRPTRVSGLPGHSLFDLGMLYFRTYGIRPYTELPSYKENVRYYEHLKKVGVKKDTTRCLFSLLIVKTHAPRFNSTSYVLRCWRFARRSVYALLLDQKQLS